MTIRPHLAAALAMFTARCAPLPDESVREDRAPTMFREAFETHSVAQTTPVVRARPAATPRLPTDRVDPGIRAARFIRQLSVYTVNSTAGTVTAFDAAADGTLTQTHTVTVGTTSYGIAFNSDATFAYVANAGSGDVTTLRVENDGALTPMSLVLVPGASDVTLHPSGKWAFVTSFDPGNRVEAFFVDPTTGDLSPTGSTIMASTSPFNSVVDPNGNFLLFATSRLPFRVYAASIDQALGTITDTAMVDTGTTPRGVEIHPSGRFVYATNIGGHQIVPHQFNAITGALSPMTPVAIQSPRGMVFDKTGAHLYVTSYTIPALTGSIVHYTVHNTRGTLTQVSSTPTGGHQTFAVQISPDGNFLYAVDVASHTLSAFKITPGSGELTQIDSQLTAEGPVALAVVERTVAVP